MTMSTIDQEIFRQTAHNYRLDPTVGWDALKDELVRDPLLIVEALPILKSEGHAREALRMAVTNADLMKGIPVRQRGLLEKILEPDGATAESLGVSGYQELVVAEQIRKAVDGLSQKFGHAVILTRMVTPGALCHTPRTGERSMPSTHYAVGIKVRR